MSESNSDLVRRLYGYNWASATERERGLAVSRELVSPDIEARMAPEVDDRTLHGLQDFADFVFGLEEDFSEFRYEPSRLSEPAPDEVLVTGQICARGRLSKMPLTAPFGHLWRLRDGKPVSVEAHLNPDDAFAAAWRAR
jgi:hypothetical protein